MKQPDSAMSPEGSHFPSIVLEVGDSESMTQLKIDAKLWIEDMPEVSQFLFLFAVHLPELLQVQLVMLLSIDPPIATHPDQPRTTIQLWRGFGPLNSSREARMVWEADWTHAATPLYFLLSDIFRGEVPAAYGDNDRVFLAGAEFRQVIIKTSQTSVLG
jgi:hypothetical protein